MLPCFLSLEPRLALPCPKEAILNNASEIEVGASYESPVGVVCQTVAFTVDPQDCIALVRYRISGTTIEEIVSTDEFRKQFPTKVSNNVH